jgi:hypothetical protein
VLRYLRSVADCDDDPREFQFTIGWFSDHEASLDWIFAGDVGGLIARCASYSNGRPSQSATLPAGATSA